MHDDQTDTSDGSAREPGPRRPYATPRLIEYGSVAKLTQGTLTRQADSSGAGFRKVQSGPP